MTHQKCFPVGRIANIDSSCACLVYVPKSWLEAPQTPGSPDNQESGGWGHLSCLLLGSWAQVLISSQVRGCLAAGDKTLCSTTAFLSMRRFLRMGPVARGTTQEESGGTGRPTP